MDKRVKHSNDEEENYEVSIVSRGVSGRERYDKRIGIIQLTIKRPKVLYPLSV